ncbi:electron transport complex subunit RsxC [Tepidibacter formicigenes]|jgi:electron transport complex protein RnfC|uniref:Ion-translocating oxidoreductase complex subunit C n=1 Tax=Tepidibacter formicigenes DSM 15518 TaxID=1123349 RepID=A0A1M6K2B6_9FIRM|nr:electron transport complex subunit RsxC [Tepidibacter formicigenes]SHJ53055.1 electron transport complex protein RnfC [Tepidibacter formicigenes DSM 15518]
MTLLTFKGGVHPPHRKKYTENIQLERAKDPATLYIPLQQHIGAPCKPIVKVGDKVKVGQKIGEPQGFVSSPVHSSVSGTVKSIKECPTPGGSSLCIIIENDFLNEAHESVVPKGDIDSLSAQEILEIIKEAGIVGMGGATFPTHVKLSPPKDKKIDTVILNGAECEPYLTADHRLMLESPEDVVYGLKAIMKVLNVENGYIGIEDNKPDAIEVMKKAAQNEKNIEVVSLRTKYPQGAEKQLIYACTKREVPSGGLPMDAGVVVNNVGTAAQIAQTIKTGMPLVERITTVTGSAIKNPKNLIIKVGTLFEEIINQCGGFKEEPGKVIMGGPMMGLTQYTLEVPVTKGASGILCLNKKDATLPKPKNCIRCGKCVDICPAFLQPLYISAHSLKYNFDKAEEYRALDCIECGSCSFICPSKRPLLQSIRVAKREIIAKKRKQNK